MQTAEKGCIEYAAAVDAEPALPVQTKYGPDTHMQAYGAKTKDLLGSRVDPYPFADVS